MKQLRNPRGQWRTVTNVKTRKRAQQIAHEYRKEGHSAKVVKDGFHQYWNVKTHLYKGGGGYRAPWKR